MAWRRSVPRGFWSKLRGECRPHLVPGALWEWQEWGSGYMIKWTSGVSAVSLSAWRTLGVVRGAPAIVQGVTRCKLLRAHETLERADWKGRVWGCARCSF